MGGLALKHTDIRRYEKEEFFELFENIKSKLPIEFKPRLLQAFREKETFGDMDIMIYAPGLAEHNLSLEWHIRKLFKPTDIVKNSNVISFDYKNLQIDFIVISDENWESSYNFFAWNDMGNFLGKIAHSFKSKCGGVKYGNFGLKYIYKSSDESRILGEIILTKNMVRILSFLGLDYDTWKNGFNTKEEIFEYILESNYYHLQQFQWDGLNALHKKRNKRRKMYHDFLEYTQNHEVFDYIRSDENTILNYIEQNFPGFLNQIEVFDEINRKRKVVKSKFNGKLVKEYYDLEGKELGQSIINFKKSFNKDGISFNDWIYKARIKTIWRQFEISNDVSGNHLKRAYRI